MESIQSGNDLLLESPLLRLPQELMRTNLKNQQKVIEKDSSYLISLLKVPSVTDCTAGLEAQLDSMLVRLNTMKRKMEVLREEEQEHLSRSRVRLEHLHRVLNDSAATEDNQSIAALRLRRLVIDFMLREGYADTARKLSTQYQIDDLLDIDVFVHSKTVADSLRNRSTQSCLTWCNEHKSTLRKSKNALEFEVRKQEFIELIRKGLLEQAIQYAHKNLSIHRELRQTEVDQVCALLCFPPGTQIEPYKRLYSHDRWEFLANLFVQTHHHLCNIPSKSPLEVALSAGLSALKTTSCYACNKPRSKNSHNLASTCPICSPELNELACEVPFSHAVRSYLVDSLSGDPLEGENEPVVLPNGHIYGLKSLKEWSTRHCIKDQMFEDPGTGELFSLTCLRKAFVL